MIEMHLSGLRARNGTVVFVCSTCKVPPNFICGAKEKGYLVYLMRCPRCDCILAEWHSLDARGRELQEFARTLKARH
jgi:uncharacterized C2H2 Zn-finger protein